MDVNQADKNGNTPFLNAAYTNKLEIVKHLSKNVKDFNFQNKDGKSALTNAVQRNSTEVVAFLLEKGANVNVKDKKGNNLIFYLLRSYNPGKFGEFKQKVALLSVKGFDFKENQKDGNSLYHLALETNDMNLLKWIHKNDVNINVKNDNGLTPLHKAAMTAKDDSMLKYLISIGADKSIKTNFDESVYDLASENELLKRNGVNIQFLK